MLVKSIPLQQESIALDVIRIILAILLPPLGVFLQVGIGLHFWLNILLTLLGYIPGIVHAIWIIARRSEEHTSELQSLMRISYAVFCLKQKNNIYTHNTTHELYDTQNKSHSVIE